jgi:hypothetical protein
VSLGHVIHVTRSERHWTTCGEASLARSNNLAT